MQTTADVGTKLFDESIQLTSISEFGFGWTELQNGSVAIPPQGARFELAFEGTLEGERMKGTIEGVDYLNVRTDGPFELNIFATITTNDGVRIAFDETGVLSPGPEGINELYLNMKFTTGDERYSWLNKVQAWGRGSVDFASGKARVTAFTI